MIYFISDTHFSHFNIITYENRPYHSVEEMNEDMINIWNSKIKTNDEVYILGDFAFRNKNIISIIKRLNGRKHIIAGNHDKDLKRNSEVFKYVIWVKDYHELKINDKFIVMSHYPILSWNRSHYGSIQLFGHIHSLRNGKAKNFPQICENQYNVCWDVLKEPCSLDEVIEKNKEWRAEVGINVRSHKEFVEDKWKSLSS